MNFQTRSEFREVLLSLYKDIQKLREDVHKPTKTQKVNDHPGKRTVVAKLDPVSSVEARTPAAEQKQQSRYQFWSILLQALTLLAVGAYAVITAKMWREMQSQTATAQRQIVIDQRAWLKFSDDPNTTFMKGQPISIPIHVTNIGKTPAEHLWWAVYTVLAPMGEEPDLPSNHIVPNDMIYKLDRKKTRQVDIPHEELERALL